MTRHVKKLLRFKGEEKTVTEWSAVTGLPFAVISNRLKLGWSTSDALSIPVGKGRGRL